jgi:hypothetical protein
MGHDLPGHDRIEPVRLGRRPLFPGIQGHVVDRPFGGNAARGLPLLQPMALPRRRIGLIDAVPVPLEVRSCQEPAGMARLRCRSLEMEGPE